MTASPAPMPVWQIGQVDPVPCAPARAEVTIGPSSGVASSALQRGQRTASPGRESGNRTRAPHWHETTAGIDEQSPTTGKPTPAYPGSGGPGTGESEVPGPSRLRAPPRHRGHWGREPAIERVS